MRQTTTTTTKKNTHEEERERRPCQPELLEMGWGVGGADFQLILPIVVVRFIACLRFSFLSFRRFVVAQQEKQGWSVGGRGSACVRASGQKGRGRAREEATPVYSGAESPRRIHLQTLLLSFPRQQHHSNTHQQQKYTRRNYLDGRMSKKLRSDEKREC
jgi:hypothetical protein